MNAHLSNLQISLAWVADSNIEWFLPPRRNRHSGDNHKSRKKKSIDGYMQSKIDDAMNSYRKYAGERAYRQSTK